MDSDYRRLVFSGTVIRGAGNIWIVDGEVVGYYLPTTDGLHHVFDDAGNRLDVFATAAEALSYSKNRWTEDGVEPPPIKLQ